MSAPFGLSAGIPTQLVLVSQPAGAASGATLARQPVVAVEDGAGNTTTNYNGTVTASIASGIGSVVNGNASVINGTASFQSLAVVGPVGTVTLAFRSGSLLPATSAPFPVLAGPAVKLGVRVGPPEFAPNGVPMSPQPVILLLDVNGNLTSSTGVVTISTDATSGTITNATAVAVNGVATFSGLTLSGPLGGRNYTFSSPSLTPLTGFRINITP